MARLLGTFLFSNQTAIGFNANAKKTPQTRGTKMKSPSRITIAPKTIIIR
jgi:hypothetical protein